MAAEESVSRKKHRRSPADEADESSKRRKHHHHRRHHSHRHRSKHDLDKRENDERRVAALNSRVDDDREEGEILDEEEENKEGLKGRMESDVESGEIKPDAEASCSKDDRLAIHGEGGEEEGNPGQRVSRPTMSGELTSNSGGNINIEFPDRTLPPADKEHVEGKFDESILEHRSSGFKEKDLHGMGVINGDVEDISSKRDVRYTESKSPTKITQDENDSMGIDSRHSRRYSRSRSPVLRESVEPSKKRRRDEDANSDKYGARRLAESSNTRSVSPNKSRDKYRPLEDSPSKNVGYHDGRNRSRSRDCVRERIFQSADDKSIIYYHERCADRSKSSDSRESSKIDYDSGICNKYNRRGQNGSRESVRELEMKRVEGKERERSSSYGLYGRNSGKDDSHSSRKVNGGGDRDRGRDRDWETHKERERSSSDIRHDGRERDRERERGKDRERSSTYIRHDGREMDRERERGRDREQTSSYSRHDERLRDREKERGQERDWERAQVRFKEREKESGRGRGRDRDREMERDKNRRDSRSHRYDYLDEGHNSQDHRDKTRSRKESNDLEESKEKAREEDEQEDYEERVALKLAEQEEEDVERIKEESRKRRQAILEKYKQQQKQSQQKHSQFQSYPFSDHTEKGDNASMLDDRPREQNSPPQASVSVVSQAVHHGLDDRHDSSDVYVADSSFSVGKSPVQNGTSDFEKTAGAGGLGDGTPKSERASDMFCDDIFGESPAGARKSGKGDALQIERNGLHDNWDDAEGYYSYRFGEVLDGRYEITAAHGKGVFSTVVRAKDLKAGKCDPQEVAIKIIRNNDTMYKAGLEELIILKKLAGADPEDKRHCVRFLSSFKYRSHLCLVFESLHMNLREVLKKFGRNIGLKLTAVRAYAKQLFIALKHLRNCGVLHCDIKPDNMLVNEAKNVLKLCDFGNAMFAGKNEITPYLVSRFYRSPEIILGLPYDHPMDIWSVGCCLYELYSGKVLFPGPSNNDMLRLHMELKGPFPKKMLRKGAFTDQHFDQDLNFHATEEDPVTKKAVKRLLLNIKLKDICSLITSSPGEDPKMLANFKDLLERIFVLDPDKRMTVSQALAHPFITGK